MNFISYDLSLRREQIEIDTKIVHSSNKSYRQSVEPAKRSLVFLEPVIENVILSKFLSLVELNSLSRVSQLSYRYYSSDTCWTLAAMNYSIEHRSKVEVRTYCKKIHSYITNFLKSCDSSMPAPLVFTPSEINRRISDEKEPGAIFCSKGDDVLEDFENLLTSLAHNKMNFGLQLTQALINKNYLAFKFLLNNGIKPDLVILFLALSLEKENRIAFLNLIIPHDGIGDVEKFAALAYAITKGDVEAVRYFLNCGVVLEKPLIEEDYFDLSLLPQSSLTPCMACDGNEFERIQAAYEDSLTMNYNEFLNMTKEDIGLIITAPNPIQESIELGMSRLYMDKFESKYEDFVAITDLLVKNGLTETPKIKKLIDPYR